ncbi:hypothetical protein PINS_up024027 [Pythium insidiosum]|nr:hypothetical protein PINS_up010094 [Pythium insidiosum]GLE11552.1 hypothetical protein PINS_up024027 [Pythium insidiosum]
MGVDTQTLLEIAATAAGGLFAGGAVYISVAQHPALLECDATEGVRASFFARMYRYAAPWQALLASISGLGAVAAGVRCLGSSSTAASAPTRAQLWIVSGGLMFAIVPYTVVTMLGLNHELMDTPSAKAKGDKWIAAALRRWARLHSVRSGASLVAFSGMVLAMSSSSERRVHVVVDRLE